MQTLINADNHILAAVGLSGSPLSFHWYKDFGPHYTARDRNDGLVYMGGFSTRELAEAWATKRGILPIEDHGVL